MAAQDTRGRPHPPEQSPQHCVWDARAETRQGSECKLRLRLLYAGSRTSLDDCIVAPAALAAEA